jgi:hypothetical protein
MEVIRGRERGCRQEIRGQARRGGTRSTQRVDSQRQAFRPVADEGLASQCLDRRIADKQILAHEVTAWQDHRNKHHAKADWQFTTANARVKLKRLYPQFE